MPCRFLSSRSSSTNFNDARYLPPEHRKRALADAPAEGGRSVVDDASLDTSRDIIREYGTRIIAVLHERNGGQGAAINTGFRASDGDIVVLLDADDYL